MKITWLAHSCFLLESGEGVRLLMDPYNEHTGYEVKRLRANIVTTSHQHGDHANLKMVEDSIDDYTLLNTTGSFSVKGFTVTGIASKHDAQDGAERGDNIIYLVECDGYRICHLGDLGHRLSRDQIAAIGRVDILMIPVGGTYTIDAQTARDVAVDLDATLVMPMHFKTEFCPYPIQSEQPFLELMRQEEYAIILHHGPTREYLPNQKPRRYAVVVMDQMY